MQPTEKLYYKKYLLKGELKRYVKYIWVIRSQEIESKRDLLIPDGYPEIIFLKKGAYRKEFLNSNKQPQIIDQSCIIGIQNQTVLASRMNRCYLIGLKLSPVGAYAIFGNQLKNISTSNSYINKFGLAWLSQLDQQIQTCTEEASIIELITNQLLIQLKSKENQKKINLATVYLDTILAVDRTTTIKELAQKHYVSVRHYQRNFKTFFGVSPKTFLNIIRFKQLYKSSILQQEIPKNFLEYGYYDQMHFIKDFQKRLGINPSKSTDSKFIQMNEIARTSL